MPPPTSSRVYELTEWGKELEPVIVALGRWGVRSPLRPHNAGMSVDALILSFRTMLDPQAAEGLSATYEFGLGEDRYRAVVDDGRFEIRRGTADRPDATVEADPATLAALVYGGQPLGEAPRLGEVKVEGDKEAVAHFLDLFPLPEPAAPAVGT